MEREGEGRQEGAQRRGKAAGGRRRLRERRRDMGEVHLAVLTGLMGQGAASSMTQGRLP